LNQETPVSLARRDRGFLRTLRLRSVYAASGYTQCTVALYGFA